MAAITWVELVTLISQKVKEGRGLSQDTFCVFIDGYTAVGKSILANDLASTLRREGSQTEILSTDDFIRFTRGEINASMNKYRDHRNWYDLERLSALLYLFRDCAPVDTVIYGLYDHSTGKCTATKQYRMQKGATLIVEGMYSMTLKLPPSYRVVLVAEHSELQQRVMKRANTRGVPSAIAEERYWIHNGSSYQTVLSSLAMDSDLIVNTTSYSMPEILATREDPHDMRQYVLSHYLTKKP